MTIIDKACFERGCACHDPRVDGEGVEVVARQWVGLTEAEVAHISHECTLVSPSDFYFYNAIERALREKNGA